MAEHKHAAVLRAIADGKAVQFNLQSTQQWFDYNSAATQDPLTCSGQWNWRIKTEPKPDVVTYLYKSMGEWRENDKRRFSSEGEVIMIVRNAEGELKSAEVLP